MLRIAVDARPLTHPRTGIGVYLKELLAQLIPGSEHRWYLYSDRPFDWDSSFGESVVRTGSANTALGGIALAQLRFSDWARQDRCDLFWSPRHHLPMRLPNDLPAVVTLHDLVFKEQPETMTFGGRNLERILTPPSLRKAGAILTTTQSVLNELGRYFPAEQSKARVIHLSSSLHEIEPFVDTEKIEGPYALYCGSLEPRKNLDRLICAFHSARVHQGVEHQLVIVTGRSWNSKSTEALISKHSAWIHYLPNVSEPHKAFLYQHCDFVALPSLHEGFGIPIVEALKMGRPILTSDRSAMPEIAQEAAEYVDPTSANSIVAAIARLCLNEAHREKLASNARRLAAGYSWDTCSRLTLSVLEACARGQET